MFIPLFRRIVRTCETFLPIQAIRLRSGEQVRFTPDGKAAFIRGESVHKESSGKFRPRYASQFEIDSTSRVREMDIQEMDPVRRYRLLCASVVPRPIAFVSTCSVDEVYNLAAFSFFMPVTCEPPSIAFSITRKKSHQKKDTLINIENTNHFVVNHLSLSIFERAYTASSEFASDVDEFEAVGLTAVPTLHGIAPRVKEAPLALECSLIKLVDVGDEKYGSSTLVLGRLLHAYVHENCMEGDRIRSESLGTVSRLAGMGYGGAETRFNVKRDSVWSEKYW